MVSIGINDVLRLRLLLKATMKETLMLKKFLLLLAFIIAVPVFAADYEIDRDHSSVTFSIKHMVISNVKGRFDNFSGHFSFEENKSALWKAVASIDAASINTGNKKRDDHLRNPDFFNVKQFPKITFESTEVKQLRGENKLLGNLTMHGVTKPVEMDLTYGGATKDPMGNSRVAFAAKTKISRKDFGITYNKVLEAGGLALGEDVTVEIEIEGIQKVQTVKAKK